MRRERERKKERERERERERKKERKRGGWVGVEADDSLFDFSRLKCFLFLATKIRVVLKPWRLFFRDWPKIVIRCKFFQLPKTILGS